MATLQTDIPYALSRAGYLNNTKSPLRYYQKWYTADEVLDEPTYLTALPRKLQHMVYQFVRPASALRRLPPKFH